MRRFLPLAAAAVLLLTAAGANAAAQPRSSRPASTRAVAASASSGASVFLIRGGGYGHGVGLSQWGTLGYAQHGEDFRAILAHYYTATQIGTVDPAQTVRVLLKTGAAGFSGASQAVSGVAGSKPQALKPNLTYTVKPLADGTLSLVDPANHEVGRFAAPLVVNGPGVLQVAGLGAYRGVLEFRPDGSGGVQTVDALELEDYVREVVAAEMPSSWPAQALETQAVAARTYAITTSVAGNGYTLYRDTRSQMFGGVAAETPATDAAVAATRGDVVTYHGTPVATYFFASSGGYTEDNEDVWPGGTPDPWLRAVRDPYDASGGDPYHRWAINLSVPAAAAKLARLVKGKLVGIRILRHGVSPRIVTGQVVGSRGTTTVDGAQLQSAFGLRSTYAAFTTITTVPTGPVARSHTTTAATAWLPARAAEAVLSVGPAVHSLVNASRRGLHGVVFPGAVHSVVVVQELGPHGWRKVTHTRLRRAGAYQVTVAGPGRYRVVYRGLDGPTVRVG